MRNSIDLHLHSEYSDGTYTVEDIYRYIRRYHFKEISITDHDTCEIYRYLPDVYEGCQLIKGVEISAMHPSSQKPVHILGYHFKTRTHIQALCAQNLSNRRDISLWQIRQLRKHGYQIITDEVIQKAYRSTSIYKQHIMDVLIDHGYCDEIYSPLYKQLFKDGGICMRTMNYVHVDEAIEAIHKDGGVAILAHPFLSNVEDEVLEYVRMGIDGIETWHSSHTTQQCLKLHHLAHKYHLIESGGSDAHGRYGNEPAIGCSPHRLLGDTLCPKK